MAEGKTETHYKGRLLKFKTEVSTNESHTAIKNHNMCCEDMQLHARYVTAGSYGLDFNFPPNYVFNQSQANIVNM